MSEVQGTLDKYIGELTEFLKITEFNVKDVQMKLPGMKHLYVGRLIRHKQTENNLKRKRDVLRSTVEKKLIAGAPTIIPASKLNNAIDNSEMIINLNNEIKDNSLIIEFLEKAEKILSSTTFDIKNIVEINKLETQ